MLYCVPIQGRSFVLFSSFFDVPEQREYLAKAG